ncbi:hypothetical protein ZIOFF_075298 [Zingiber officinale]|uniref:Uncharacterized protein n=1 Tax=Zingiber officinale TaxID=94328 RepID=A0A8J5E8L5_ZINOF|nr:hypothetical protein ZIOFF_075298 [Zingiber officinale]
MDSVDCQLQSMENEAPSWADQWGTGGLDADDSKYKESGKDNKKMEKVKAFASSSFGKAKAAATVGASKAKSSTNTGIKWIKTRATISSFIAITHSGFCDASSNVLGSVASSTMIALAYFGFGLRFAKDSEPLFVQYHYHPDLLIHLNLVEVEQYALSSFVALCLRGL